MSTSFHSISETTGNTPLTKEELETRPVTIADKLRNQLRASRAKPAKLQTRFELVTSSLPRTDFLNENYLDFL